MLYLYEEKIISNLKKYAQMDPNLKNLIVFGSYARREHRPDSDIDVLVISTSIKKSEEIFSKLRDETYINTTVLLSFHYITPDEYESTKDPFYTTIKQEGEIIW